LSVNGQEHKCLITRYDDNINVVFGESDNLNYLGSLYITTSK